MSASTTASNPPLHTKDMVTFALPSAMVGYMMSLLSLYVMKYATDVLLIAPAVMGTIFGLSRIWDAISDPMVGYLSDKTKVPFGRRRSWILGGTIPATIVWVMMFSMPAGANATFAALWMGFAIFAFYTAMTSISVPHLSLGAELTQDYGERNRLFGLRHVSGIVGGIGSILTLAFFTSVQVSAPEKLTAYVQSAAVIAGLILLVSALFMVAKLRERTTGFKPPERGIYSAGADVLKNPHARILLWVTFIEAIGGAALTASALYVAEYVLGNIQVAPIAIIAYLIMSTVSVPGWLALSRTIEKTRLWFYSMLLTACSMGGMFFLVFIPQGLTQISVNVALAALAGVAAGCGGTIAPSIQSDVIDYDELQTGERKEGAYFAIWNFAYKSAAGVTLMVTGFVLSIEGFIPNQEQTLTVKIAMCGLLGLFPFVCYMTGAFLFTRFRLDSAMHRDIMRQIYARRAASEEVASQTEKETSK